MSDSTGKTTEYLTKATGQPRAAKRTFSIEPVAPLPRVLGSAVPKSVDDVAESLKNKISPEAVLQIQKDQPGDPFVVVKSNLLPKIIEFLRDDEKYYCSNLSVISAVDYPKVEAGKENSLKVSDCIEVVYVLQSYIHRHQIMIKVQLDRNAPKVDSICHLYRSANWYERECFDMLGVQFDGHPNLKRILLPPDWVGHPLRKDYVFPEEYNGMKVPL